MSKPLKGFISYSHENKSEKDRLIKFLAVMEQRNELKTWHDANIIAGDPARQEVEASSPKTASRIQWRLFSII